MYIISVKPRKFHLGRPWHRISLKCLIESYQFSRCLVRGIYTEGICLVLCNDDGIVYTSLSTFVATMFPLVFANQPKALVCNEGCHSIITTKTTGKKPVEAWMGHRELSWKRYYNRSRQMWRESIRGTSVRKLSIVNTRSVILGLSVPIYVIPVAFWIYDAVAGVGYTTVWHDARFRVQTLDRRPTRTTNFKTVHLQNTTCCVNKLFVKSETHKNCYCRIIIR